MPVRPRYYRLILMPDLAARRFEARVSIGLEGEAEAVVLDCVDLDIAGVEADGAPAPWSLADGRLTVRARAAELVIAYAGPIRDEARGLYGDGEWLFSHLQPTHARRVFPCFDDPAFRCPFTLSVKVVPSEFPVGNARMVRCEDGMADFEPTPPLPTNLLAVAVGPFRRHVDLTGKMPVAAHFLDDRPDGLERTHHDLALGAAARALAFNTDWHGLPPPIAELDLVLAPSLPVAGMESAGAIFLREADVLIDEPNSPAERARDIAEMVAHEVAHQWFGGLVSPRGWKDLWLNEGFATWMAAKFIRSLGPDPAYEAVQARATRAAMAVDQAPLRRDAVTEAEIAARFDIAAYRKGAAVLDLLEAWLGENAFRAGVRRYVRQGAAAGGLVTADDLWAALEAESGAPVALVAAPLAERPGVPTLAFSRDGGDLVIRQLGEPRVMPVFIRTATGARTLLLKTVEARLPVEGWAFGNAWARGYYRCRHDFEVPLEGLDEAELVALQEDAWDGAWNGTASLTAYLDLAERLMAAGRGLDTLGPRLDELAELMAGGPRRAAFDAWRAAAPPAALNRTWVEVSGQDADTVAAARAAFQQAQQARFDAWLLHRGVSDEASPELLAEHRRVNGLAAALRGALWLRGAFDREGLAAPAWMQSAADLAAVSASVERLAAQQARGQCCAPDLSELAQRLADELNAVAGFAEQALGRLAGADPAAPRLVALMLAREAAARAREHEGAQTFAELFHLPAPAPPPDAGEVADWLERTERPVWRNDRMALREAAATLPAALRARAARLATGEAAPPPPASPPRRRAPLPQTGRPIRLTLPDGAVVKADFPTEPTRRAQGLMYRERLSAGEGMLFALPDAGPHPFFMRGVRIPLDIAWLDAEGRVLHVERGEPGSEAALPADFRLAVGRWVLELAGGEAARHGMVVGARVEGLPA